VSHRLWTTTDRRRALDVLRAGHSAPEASRATGVPDATVRKWAARAGVPIPASTAKCGRPPYGRDMAAEAVRRVRAGERLAVVARSLGCDAGTVRSMCRTAGVASPSPGRPRARAAWEAARLVRERGITYAAAARETGAVAATVRDIVHRPTRRRKAVLA
jgi:transposase-like protein